MTELETMQRAKMYMDKLSRGIDPITDRQIPEDSALNQVRLAKCFSYVSGVLEKVIDNGGVVGEVPKRPFAVTPQQLRQVRISQEPVRVTQLAEMIHAAAETPGMKKLSTTVITNWLLKKGFLEKQTTPDGRNQRVPTRAGLQLGLTSETRQGQQGEYQAVFYNAQAQQFILNNLGAILADQ